MRRVLQNLVSNAIKYTTAGKVLVGVRRRGGKLSVQVRDTGPGIPKGKRALIFKEFQRLEETAHSVRGLGLGLAIVERIGKVLDHGIELQSVPGRGSMFCGRTAAGGGAAAADARPIAAAPTAGRIAGLRVLCIDNEPDVLNGMQALLEGWGCTALMAQNAARGHRAAARDRREGRTSSWPTTISTAAPGSRRWRRCAPPPRRTRR